MSSLEQKKKWKVIALVFAGFGLMVIHNQQLAVSDPENTYFNKIGRTIRLLLNPEDDEVFFGNSGGAIVECGGKLVGIVSMMSNYRNSQFKQGIGINANAISSFIAKMKRAR